MIKDYFPGSCRCRIVVLIALSLLSNTGKNTSGLLAQDLTGRPRVGLVLSGGGALGLVHVGILKVMEESGLRPDLITGVSMGSIIGGMYAIGCRADTLQKLIVTNNWDMVFSNKIPENKVIFPEKRLHYLLKETSCIFLIQILYHRKIIFSLVAACYRVMTDPSL